MATPASARDNLLIRVASDLSDLRDSPRMCILIASGFLELLTNALIDQHCKNPKTITKDSSRDFPYFVKLILLNELGLLPDDLYERLNAFRKLRNRAAHDAVFTVTEKEIQRLSRAFRPNSGPAAY